MLAAACSGLVSWPQVLPVGEGAAHSRMPCSGTASENSARAAGSGQQGAVRHARHRGRRGGAAAIVMAIAAEKPSPLRG